MRDPCRSPLYQVQLSLIDTAEGDWRLPGIVVTPCDVPPQPGKSDLNLDVYHQRGGYRLDLSYYADRYDEATAAAFAGQLAAVIGAAVADPARSVLSYQLADSADPADPVALAATAARPQAAVTAAAPPQVATSPGTTPPHPAPPWAGLTRDDVLAVPCGGAAPHQRALAAVLAGPARLAVPGDAATAGPDALAGWLADCAASGVYLTPPLLRALAADADGELPLRWVFVASRGDLIASDIGRLQRLAPGCEVVAVCPGGPGDQPLAWYRLSADWQAEPAPLRVPLGVPLPPARLAGPAGQPPAVGEVAALSADGLRPGLPVRLRPDGLLDFTAPAVDHLETVAALLDLPGVRDAVVTGHPGPDGGTVLTACLAAADSLADLGRLRQRLVTTLPRYLIPVRIELLRRLPLTPGGEHDLAALADGRVAASVR